MRNLYISVLFLIASVHVSADSILIKNDRVRNADVREAAIWFNGGIDNRTVTWLLSSLDDIRGQFSNINNVDIYINSEGGDMDAGYLAWEVLRKSPVTLNMINASMTGSAATLLYCASGERYTMPHARFLLHPAAAWNDKDDYLKPDQARRILEDAEDYNSLFRTVYSSCTTLTDEELRKITSSETGRVVPGTDAAEKLGLVSRGVREPHSYPVNYYITDSGN
ncbi:hypothetical protein UJ50_002783 [Salmonella enterica subsp. enterica]|nr:hypothetical protein [Salmonella enterica subsp. enterica]